MTRYRWLFAALVLLAATASSPARAASDAGERGAALSLPLLDRFGLARIAGWLRSEDESDRLRGIERAGELRSAAALGELVGYAVERRAQLLGRELLALVRALAPNAGEESAGVVLSMILNQGPSRAGGPDEAAWLDQARAGAALALAAEGGAGAQAVLARALRTPGRTAALAADALRAHPPRSLGPLIDLPGPPSVELARLLGALGDQRAFHHLRGWVRSGPAEVRAAAAIALTQLGHLETVPLAARWLDEPEPELVNGALEILLLAQDARAWARLGAGADAVFAGPAERQRWLESAGPELPDALLEKLGEGATLWGWALLGRSRGAGPAQRLAAGLKRGDGLGPVQALARRASGDAHAILQRALDAGRELPLVVRAAAARRHRYGERFEGLDERVAALLVAPGAAERAAGAWARAFGGGEPALSELGSKDEVRVLAALAHGLRLEGAGLDAAARLVSSGESAAVRAAASVCLRSERARASVSSAALWSLVAESRAARPLALRALAARGDPGLWGTLSSQLDSVDPLAREHVARGLGESGRVSAVGPLVRRLAYEPDADVRQAIVSALAAFEGPLASEWLRRSAQLDASASVRAAARLALVGVPLADPPPGDELLWVELRATGAAPEGGSAVAGGVPAPALVVSVAPGLAIAVFADPAGWIVVSGVTSSVQGIRLQ